MEYLPANFSKAADGGACSSLFVGWRRGLLEQHSCESLILFYVDKLYSQLLPTVIQPSFKATLPSHRHRVLSYILYEDGLIIVLLLRHKKVQKWDPKGRDKPDPAKPSLPSLGNS